MLKNLCCHPCLIILSARGYFKEAIEDIDGHYEFEAPDDVDLRTPHAEAAASQQDEQAVVCTMCVNCSSIY